MNPALVTLFCGLLFSLTAFSIDIMLPALADMRDDLGAPMQRVQLVVPVFAAGYAASQLIFGPLSDRFGRRPTIIAGLVVYLTGSLVAAATASIELILAGRALQGMGGGAGASDRSGHFAGLPVRTAACPGHGACHVDLCVRTDIRAAHRPRSQYRRRLAQCVYRHDHLWRSAAGLCALQTERNHQAGLYGA